MGSGSSTGVGRRPSPPWARSGRALQARPADRRRSGRRRRRPHWALSGLRRRGRGAAAVSTRHLRRKAVFARGMSGGSAVISLLAMSDHTERARLRGRRGRGDPAMLAGVGLPERPHRRAAVMRWGPSAPPGVRAASGAAAVGVGGQGRPRRYRHDRAPQPAWPPPVQGDAAGACGSPRARPAWRWRRGTAWSTGATVARIVPITAQQVSARSPRCSRRGAGHRVAAQAAAIADDRLAVTAGTVDVDAVAGCGAR